VGLALVQTLRLWARAVAQRRRLALQTARAVAGEAAAERLLARAGYRVQERQASGSWSVRVDGEERAVALRADFIVTRRGRRYVAEVKTGEEAPHIAAPATRRQLLEYRCAFGVEGVLLVDAEAGRVHAVEFKLPAPPRAALGLRARVVTFVIGIVVGAALVVVALQKL
jgi:hypothetical protein